MHPTFPLPNPRISLAQQLVGSCRLRLGAVGLMEIRWKKQGVNHMDSQLFHIFTGPPPLWLPYPDDHSLLCGPEYGTWNLGKLSKPGKSSISPVPMLKQAPCQGQRTLPLDRTPKKTNKPCHNYPYFLKLSFLANPPISSCNNILAGFPMATGEGYAFSC